MLKLTAYGIVGVETIGDKMGKTALRFFGLEDELTNEKLINYLAKYKVTPYYDPSYDNVLFRPKQSPSFSRTLRYKLNLKTKEDCERVKDEIKHRQRN